jgi:hypothetical protein
MSERPVPEPNLQQQRDRTIRLLCDHYAQDRLDVTDFEGRLDVAHRATSGAQLAALLQDLPAPAPARAPVDGVLTRGGRVVHEAVRDTRTLIAFLGGVERRGPWTPARKTVVIAFMGGAELDFREVELPPGVTEVFLFCLMGGAEILVPPGLGVDANGIAIMGAFEHVSSRAHTDPNAPVLRINGMCMMGAVEISVRHPGESAKDARLRRRDEQRALREQHRDRLRGGE